MLRLGEIRRHCRIPSFYDRGNNIIMYHSGNIENVYMDQMDDQFFISADIQGSDIQPYRTELLLDVSNPEDERIDAYRCTCMAYTQYQGMCKHGVALALLYRRQKVEQKVESVTSGGIQSAPATRETSPGLSGILARYNAVLANAPTGVQQGSVVLLPNLRYLKNYEPSHWVVEFSISAGKKYVVKNQPALIYRVVNGSYFSYGKNLSFAHSREMFEPRSQQLLDIMERLIRKMFPSMDRYDWESPTRFRSISIDDNTADQIMDLYIGETIPLEGELCEVREDSPDLTLTLSPEGEQGADLRVSAVQELTGKYMRRGNVLYGVSRDFQEQVVPFLRAMEATGNIRGRSRAYLSQADYRSFCGNLLPRLRPFLRVQIKGLDLSAYEPTKPEFVFRLGMDAQGAVTLQPQVRYGGAQYSLLRIQEGEYRAAELELPVREAVARYFPIGDGPILRCQDDETAYRFLQEGVEELRKLGEVLVEESAKHVHVAQAPRVKVRVSLAGGLIDVNTQVEELPQEEMERLLKAYTQKKKFVRLSSGEFLSLEEGSLAVLSEINRVVDGAEMGHGTTQAYRAQYLNALLTGEDSGIEVERSSDFKSLVRRVRDYRDSDYQVPKALQANLRSYQKIGFRWMSALADCGLGGILADDMGLGKTVQTIALMLNRGGRNLIVCPASLVYNWEAELRRFAPSLRVELVLGAATARRETLEQEADVYVTSYDLLRRDVALYDGQNFDCCILDEAQYVRNAETKLAKAVKRISSAVRFALTGTPIFNRLGDLWSIFDFLMPGYLYSYPRFRDLLEEPIGAGDENASRRLQQMTAPFVLRRRKSDVLKELPEKVESVQYVDMTLEQRQLYLAQEQQLRQSLQSTDDKHFRQERIAFLAGLTRLRQLCCTPELYLEDYYGGSGKVSACMELLEEAAESEHKVLVFSQFTTMLDTLYAEAERRNLRALMLTGQNTKEQRREMVKGFQAGKYDVFFISLKAGGTGLNLTAADRIIHFDPWWNAAAEDQATDRAHRIGQTRTVFVTKLVAKDTVEERILALQKQKRELSDRIMENAEAGDGTFSRETLLSLLSDAQAG